MIKMKKIAIIQSNFLPWKGYFDIIHSVDLFIFYDCVQFTKQDWRTRNYIKTHKGIKQITIPVHGSISLKINEIQIVNSKWQQKIYKTFKFSYGKTEFFNDFSFILEHLFCEKKWKSLSAFNQYSIKYISNILDIKTKFINSKELELSGSKTDRVIEAIKKVGGNFYLSGPSAKNYIENKKFKENNIELAYIDYSTYPEYSQLWGEFNHNVSILDLIFNTGKKASFYIWGYRERMGV